MRHGYSNVLRAPVCADDVPWKGCEALQIVCPCCREPLYVNKSANGATRDYLAHYPGSAADVEHCELRVVSMNLAGVGGQEVLARGQDLAHFLRVIDDALALVTPLSLEIEAGIDEALRSSARVHAHRTFSAATICEDIPNWMRSTATINPAMVRTMAMSVGAHPPSDADVASRSSWAIDFMRTLSTPRCAVAFSRLHRRAWASSMKLCLDHATSDDGPHASAYDAAERMMFGLSTIDEQSEAMFEDLAGAAMKVLLLLIDYAVWRDTRRMPVRQAV